MSEARDWKARVDELFAAALNRTLSRREVLWRAGAMGLAAPILMALDNATRVAEAAKLGVEWYPKPDQKRLAAEQVLRFADGPIETLDPGVSNGGTSYQEILSLYEGLVGVDARTGKVELLGAEKMVPNDDASEYTFTLRSDLKFSDGTPITAKDYEWSWKRVLLPETKSRYPEAMYPIRGALDYTKDRIKSLDEVGIKALDDRTLKVWLVGPTPYFPLLASTWTFCPVPKHVIDKVGEKWTEVGNFAGTGPYMIKDWKFDQSLTLVKNPLYVGPVPPIIDRVEYTLYADPVAQGLVSFESDELDQAQVVGADLDRVRSDPKLGPLLSGILRSATEFVAMDTNNPPFNDVRFRQALSMAINRDQLARQVLKDQMQPSQVILSPDIPGYNPEAALGENVEKAKALLAQVGSSFRPLTLAFRPTSVWKAASEYLQQAWKSNLGLEVRLESMEPRAFSEWRLARRSQPYDMYFTWWGSDYGDPANWHNFCWFSEADFYITRWKNAEFDRLVETARGMTDVEKRIQMYKDAEKILVSETPAIPLYNPKRFFVTNPKMKGVYHDPLSGIAWIKYIWLEG